MKIPFVDLKSQYESIKEEILETINKVISNSAFIGGSFLGQFETNFAKFCEVGNCIGVGNGTDAIFIALKLLGIGQGDEVITAANSLSVNPLKTSIVRMVSRSRIFTHRPA